jgi:hypothetical protein
MHAKTSKPKDQSFRKTVTGQVSIRYSAPQRGSGWHLPHPTPDHAILEQL